MNDGGNHMTEVLSKTIPIRSEHVDAKRTLRLSALLMMLQEIALDHSQLLGLGSDQTLNRNILWVVSRYHIRIERLPRYEETVTLETWPGPMRRVLFPRYFRMKDAAGNELLKASSLWVLIDGEARKMINPKSAGLTLFEGIEFGDELPYNVSAKPLEIQRRESFTVPYSYLDFNRHMNNTRYFDLCTDLIADEIAEKKPVSILAEYQNEVHYKETIRVDIGSEDGAYLFVGTGEKPSFRIGLCYASEEA